MYETCDCKVWLLSSSIWYDFGRVTCPWIFRNWFLVFFGPPKSGVFWGGRRHFCTNLRRQSSRASPIFPRTERVLAESPATMRESCSPEMKRIWPFWPFCDLKLKMKAKINAHVKKKLNSNPDDASDHFLSAKHLHTRPSSCSTRARLVAPCNYNSTTQIKDLRPNATGIWAL